MAILCWAAKNSLRGTVRYAEIIRFWTIMGGATIIPHSLKTTGMNKNFQDRLKTFLFLKSYMTL
jgi:hypothetical protein